jgi:hypothetical protein
MLHLKTACDRGEFEFVAVVLDVQILSFDHIRMVSLVFFPRSCKSFVVLDS